MPSSRVSPELILDCGLEPLALSRDGRKLDAPEANTEIMGFLERITKQKLAPRNVLSISVFSLPLDQNEYQWGTAAIVRDNFGEEGIRALKQVVRYGDVMDLSVGRDVGKALPPGSDYVIHLARRTGGTQQVSGPRRSKILPSRTITCETIGVIPQSTVRLRRADTWTIEKSLAEANTIKRETEPIDRTYPPDWPTPRVSEVKKELQEVLVSGLGPERAARYPVLFGPLLKFGDVLLILPASLTKGGVRRIAAGLTVVVDRAPTSADVDRLHAIAVLVGQKMALLSALVEQTEDAGAERALGFVRHELSNAFPKINWGLPPDQFRDYVKALVEIEGMAIEGADDLLTGDHDSTPPVWDVNLRTNLCLLTHLPADFLNDVEMMGRTVSKAGILLLLELMRNLDKHSMTDLTRRISVSGAEGAVTIVVECAVAEVDVTRTKNRILIPGKKVPAVVRIVRAMRKSSPSAVARRPKGEAASFGPPEVRYYLPREWCGEGGPWYTTGASIHPSDALGRRMRVEVLRAF